MKLNISNFHFLLTACIVLLATSGYSQKHACLDRNNINACFSASGGLFQKDSLGSQFEVKTAGKALAYTGGSWISAYRADTLFTAVKEYGFAPGQGGDSDFDAGPVADNYNATRYVSDYERFWKISQSQIDQHRNNYSNPGYIAPREISSWPGNGDTTNGMARRLAPFKDLNNNDIYEPVQGEHPVIAGDEAVYIIYNDDRRSNPLTQAKGMGLEIHLLIYAFNRPNDSALHNTLFMHYRVVNRSTNTYDNLIFSAWNDVDLGNNYDDKIGSDSTLSLGYVYNGDLDDEGPLGFGTNPPALGVLGLSENIRGHMGYFNTGSSQRSETSDPDSALHFRYYMQNLWKDSTSLKLEKGGDGYSNSDTLPTSLWIGDGWDINWPRDIRSLMNFKAQSLAPGQSACYDLAYMYGRDADTANRDVLAALDVIRNGVGLVQSHYEHQYFVCTDETFGTQELRDQKLNLQIGPNPSDGTLHLTLGDVPAQLSMQIMDASGRIIEERSLPRQRNIRLDLELKPGLYMYRISGEGTQQASGKLVIR